VVDRNNIQISGKTDAIWPLDHLSKRFESHNWSAILTEGHDITKLLSAFKRAKHSRKPTVIIAKTTLGKGVSFMEDIPAWHGKAPSKEDAKKAIKEIKYGIRT
jgi:transketolase